MSRTCVKLCIHTPCLKQRDKFMATIIITEKKTSSITNQLWSTGVFFPITTTTTAIPPPPLPPPPPPQWYESDQNLWLYQTSFHFISMEMVNWTAKYGSFTKPHIILMAHITFVLHKRTHYSITLTSHWSTKVTEPLYYDIYLCSRTREWVKLW